MRGLQTHRCEKNRGHRQRIEYTVSQLVCSIDNGMNLNMSRTNPAHSHSHSHRPYYLEMYPSHDILYSSKYLCTRFSKHLRNDFLYVFWFVDGVPATTCDDLQIQHERYGNNIQFHLLCMPKYYYARIPIKLDVLLCVAWSESHTCCFACIQWRTWIMECELGDKLSNLVLWYLICHWHASHELACIS